MPSARLVLCLLGTQIAVVCAARTRLFSSSTDPCSSLGGKTWVSPQEARDCMLNIPFDKQEQENVLDVITKTLPFHASTNYQLQAPKPYDGDVHWDLLQSLQEIRSKVYPSGFDFHRDVQQSVKRVNDGHLMYANWCYDGVYITYNPFPLVLLSNLSDNTQAIHITPNAHEIAFSAFGEESKIWEDAFGRPLQDFSGARVTLIDGGDPFLAVNINAQTAGRFQGLSSRQNGFFSATFRGQNDWSYVMGDFAEKALPIVDSVRLTVKRVNSDVEETINVPYRSKLNRNQTFSSTSDYQNKFCKPTKHTNGHHLYELWSQDPQEPRQSVMRMAEVRQTEIVLPQPLKPSLLPLEESYKDTQFYVLEDKTGVLVIGSFNGYSEDSIKCKLFQGLQKMRGMGVENLIIDLTNNPGGYICVAHFLHRLLFGENDQTFPQPGLDTKIRVNNLVQRIVKGLAENDPNGLVIYNRPWRNATHQIIEAEDWFNPTSNVTINGHKDTFSQRLGRECEISSSFCSKQPLGREPLFKAENIVVLSNGRCGSSCALLSVLLAKKHAVRTVVVGGKADIPQQYCGFVGGEAASFEDIDTALITTELKQKSRKNSPDIPPSLTVNAAMTVTWRLAYGVENPNEPEEWQDHTATMNFPLTADIANKPQAIWESVSRKVFSLAFEAQPVLRVQVP